MSQSGKKSSDGPASVPEQAALVPHPEFARKPWDTGQLPPSGEEPQPGWHPGVPPYFQELDAVWIQLGSDWSSVVIIPSEPDDPTAHIGRALSQVGARLSIYPVEFIDASTVDLESSSRLIARLKTAAGAEEHGAPANRQQFASSSWAPPIKRTIVALENPLANPLVVPIALASDGVVLCVRRGRDRIASVRDTIQAVGGHLILCCVLLE